MFTILEKITFINKAKEGFIYECRYKTLSQNGRFLDMQVNKLISEYKIKDIDKYIKEYNKSIYSSVRKYN